MKTEIKRVKADGGMEAGLPGRGESVDDNVHSAEVVVVGIAWRRGREGPWKGVAAGDVIVWQQQARERQQVDYVLTAAVVGDVGAPEPVHGFTPSGDDAGLVTSLSEAGPEEDKVHGTGVN